MSTHGTRRTSPATPRLPGAIPFALPAVSRVGWELGSKIVAGASLLGEWDHRPSGRALAVHDATENTVVLCVRTPAGRERFFAAAKREFEPNRSRLADAEDWRRRE